MGAETAALYVLGASGVLGTVGSMASSSATNRANKQMASEANELNREMFYEQNAFNQAERIAAQQYNTSERQAAQDYNTQERREAQQFAEKMWNLNNEYNSPAAQADRLRAAGFNPANSLGDVASTSPVQTVAPASSSGSSVSPASAGSFGGAMMPEMQNVFETRMLVDNLNSVVSALDKQQDIVGKSIDNETRSARNKAEIDNMIASKQKILADTKISKTTRRKIQREIENLKIQGFILDNQNKMQGIQVKHTEELLQNQLQAMRDQHDESVLRQDSVRFANKIAPEVHNMSKQELSLKIKDVMSNLQLRLKQGEKLDREIVLDELHQEGIRFENRLTESRLNESAVESSRAQEVLDRRHSNSFFRFADDILYYIKSNTLGALKLK